MGGSVDRVAHGRDDTLPHEAHDLEPHLDERRARPLGSGADPRADHGLHYGSSVFEGIRAYATNRGTAVLALDAHVARFFQSCKIVGLELRFTPDEIRSAIRATVKKSGHPHCYIRPIAFRGYGALGVFADDCPIDVVIAAFLGRATGARARSRTASTRASRAGGGWLRHAAGPRESPGTTSTRSLVVQEARGHGFQDGLVLDVEGYSEGSGTSSSSRADACTRRRSAPRSSPASRARSRCSSHPTSRSPPCRCASRARCSTPPTRCS